jgi:hypothetical protein
MPKRSRRDSSTLARCERPPEDRREPKGKSLVREDTKLRLRAQTRLPADPLPPKTTRLTDSNSPKSRLSFSRHRHNFYIYAHDLASCNTDCCWTYGNLGHAVRLRGRKFNGSLLLLVLKPSLSGEAPRSCDPYPYQVSQQSLHGDRSLAFESGRGWLFLRKSMVYNARVHGADAVVHRSANTRYEISFRQVPPQMDWVPIRSRRGKDGKVHSHRVPFVRPGYTQRWVEVITAIDAEMIVLER